MDLWITLAPNRTFLNCTKRTFLNCVDSNIFLSFEPLKGRRQLKVTTRRTKVDWAHYIKELVDEEYFQAEKIILDDLPVLMTYERMTNYTMNDGLSGVARHQTGFDPDFTSAKVLK